MSSNLFPSAVDSHQALRLLKILSCINWSVSLHVMQPGLRGCIEREETSFIVSFCSNFFQPSGACRHLCRESTCSLQSQDQCLFPNFGSCSLEKVGVRGRAAQLKRGSERFEDKLQLFGKTEEKPV